VTYEELKARQSVMWGNGPYQRVTETLTDCHQRIIDRLSPLAGVTYLDLACGTGAVAELAAQAGARVTGVDLAPDMIETAKQRAGDLGLDIDYRVGDCENLDLPDHSFDRVSSSCGVMFAPDHEATAAELARVTRPGGSLAMVNWTPEGGVGAMFRLMAPFQPAPPPSSPFDWGNAKRVDELLGGAFDLTIEEHTSTVRQDSGEAYWKLFSTSYGPTKTLVESLSDERRDELHREWVEFFEREYPDGHGGVAHQREYLLVLGTRR
jgi:ubiquinone/menaquinone biosynthesis C-methylase UbiE